MKVLKKYPAALLALPIASSLMFVSDRMTQLAEDGAVYMLLAKSLWSGTGYRSIWTEGNPVHVHFPPLLPVTLAPSWGLFGQHLLPPHLLMVVAFGVGAWLGYRLLCTRMNPLPAAAWTVYVISSPLYLQTVGAVNTENIYIAFTLGGLLLLEGENKNAKTWIAAIALFSLAFFTRTIGFTIFIAAAIFALISHKDRTKGGLWAAAALGSGALLMALWSMWTKTGTGGRTYVRELFIKDPGAAEPVTVGMGDMAARFADNIGFYGGEVVTLLAYEAGVVRKISPALFTAGCVVVLAVVFIGWLRWVSTRRSAAAVYLLIYFGPILLWFWQYTRFIMPVLVLTGICFSEGLVFLCEKIRGENSKPWAEKAITVVAAVLIMGNIAGVVHDLRQPQPPQIADYFEISEVLSKVSAPGEVVVCRKAGITGWITGLKMRTLGSTRTVEQVFAIVNGADWLIVDEIDTDGRASAESAISFNPGRFELMEEAGPTRLYRILPRRESMNQ